MISNYYTIEPYDIYAHKFKITIQIDLPNENSQKLIFPTWIPGSYLIRDFSRHVERIKAFSNKTPVNIKN